VADESSSAAKRLVFVSHSGPDTWVAKRIAREIEARGATTFLDEGQVDAGADFEEEILDFLQRAHELVVSLTPWVLERPYVWAEIGAAWGRRIPIIALLLGITAAELQVRPGTPVFLKKRDLLDLNDIGVYLRQLAARMRREGKHRWTSQKFSFRTRRSTRTGRGHSHERSSNEGWLFGSTNLTFARANRSATLSNPAYAEAT
jgi:hypothetical protein